VTLFVAHDVTRLLRRYAVPSPNGIDRIDIAYAGHFITRSPTAHGGVYLHGLEPRLLSRTTLAALLSAMEEHWTEEGSSAQSQYARVRERLLGQAGPKATAALRSPPFSRLSPLRLLRPHGLISALFERIPDDAVFIHATHFPAARLFRWLRRRPDVKPVFFVHDLLPLQFPEYFAPTHIAEHQRSLEICARYARAVIVNTHAVENAMAVFLRRHGRPGLPMLVRPMPPDPVFLGAPDAGLADAPYFVVCGTIEPRKNHLLLLHVWRELARQSGKRTPKLVVIGRRGWENENVVDLLDRSHELREHVIEADALPSAAVARLLAGARALLMPSFAEGYGLPIVEASAMGTPVIASDIPVFREIAPGATFRGPLDGPGWLAAVQAHAEAASPSAIRELHRIRDPRADYFAAVESFIAAL